MMIGDRIVKYENKKISFEMMMMDNYLGIDYSFTIHSYIHGNNYFYYFLFYLLFLFSFK